MHSAAMAPEEEEAYVQSILRHHIPDPEDVEDGTPELVDPEGSSSEGESKFGGYDANVHGTDMDEVITDTQGAKVRTARERILHCNAMAAHQPCIN